MPRKWQLILVAGASVLTLKAVEGAALWLGHNGPNVWQSISAAAFVVGTVLLTLANLLWRRIWAACPALASKLFPDLNGRWEGHLISTWVNPDTGQTLSPIDTTIIIEQTLLNTHVSMRTSESQSISGRVVLERLAMSGRFRVWYDYRNGPKAQVQHRSAPHDGFALLEIDVNTDADVLEGRYYTERKTTGDISVKRARPNTS